MEGARTASLAVMITVLLEKYVFLVLTSAESARVILTATKWMGQSAVMENALGVRAMHFAIIFSKVERVIVMKLKGNAMSVKAMLIAVPLKFAIFLRALILEDHACLSAQFRMIAKPQKTQSAILMPKFVFHATIQKTAKNFQAPRSAILRAALTNAGSVRVQANATTIEELLDVIEDTAPDA